LIPGFSPKNLGYFQKTFSIEIEIKLISLYILISALFQSLLDLETAIEIRKVHKRFIKLRYYFGTTCYRVFGLKFSLYLEGSRLFRLYLLNPKRLDKEKISVQKFITL